MANCWDVLSKVASNVSAREVGDVTQTASPTYQELINICAKLHLQVLNLETKNHFLHAEIQELSRRNAKLALELAGEGEVDDGDYYVASPMQSRRTH